jgi:hypothetical protein
MVAGPSELNGNAYIAKTSGNINFNFDFDFNADADADAFRPGSDGDDDDRYLSFGFRKAF